jgi:biopolymer transport protein TolR
MRTRYHGWTRTAVKWPNRIYCRVDAYPLVGLSFSLFMIFAILTASPPHHGGPDLPRTRNASPMPRAVREDAQIVSVMPDGVIYYGNFRISTEELHDRIRESVRNGADRKIYIRADARAKYFNVKQVLNEISTAGIEKVCFFAERVSP